MPEVPEVAGCQRANGVFGAGCRASACAWVCLHTVPPFCKFIYGSRIQVCTVARKQPVHMTVLLKRRQPHCDSLKAGGEGTCSCISSATSPVD